MCPTHIVPKWKDEVERLVPNGKGYIVDNIDELMEIEDKMVDKNKKEHMFIILSKESAKFSYEKRPAANWSISKKTFVCPDCGRPLKKEVFHGEGRQRYKVLENFTEEDFLKEYAHNQVCINKVKVLNKETNKIEEVDCGAKLWGPLNKFESNCKWVKLGKHGWIYRSHFERMYQDYYSRRERLNKKEQEFLLKLMEKKEELEETGKLKSSSNGVRKYSIARYIKERHCGDIDYFIADELHEYKGGTDSLQGSAMGDLANVSKKVIGLTGTLLNGYANGLFYILYRTMPEVMQKEGFDYSDENEFQRMFGVVKRTSVRENDGNARRARAGRSLRNSEKNLAGVSPLVFTKFLLENAVFVSISDMAEGLPQYTEYPLGVDMDRDLTNAYENFERELRTLCSPFRGGAKIMGSFIPNLSTYPDMPYDCLPILHPDTGEAVITPPELPRGTRNKERALLDLVLDKKAKGEKVLVYYEWTNKTDVATKLSELFASHDIRSANLTTKVKAKERSKWIDDKAKDVDVLMCNPNLVKTGLDLLDFTTIVFYQMGYNIFTMRQASRRSWRLSQTKDIEVYFMYYKGTVQEQAISLMASKLQASMAIEGKASEEGLRAMADNEDMLSKIAMSVVEGIKYTVDADVFGPKASTGNSILMSERIERERSSIEDLLVQIFERPVFEYLLKDTDTTPKQTNNYKAMKNFLSGKSHVANLFRPAV